MATAHKKRQHSFEGILNYETGDSWNGTHSRTISVEFNPEVQTVTVISTTHDIPTKAEFPLSEVRHHIASGAVKNTKHFKDFAAAAKRAIPDLDFSDRSAHFENMAIINTLPKKTITVLPG